VHDWDLPSPHVQSVVASAADMDAYGHVNNGVYVGWLDRTAWSHSSALGLPPESCVSGRRGMAVWRTQIHYLAPAFAGDLIEVGTWIVATDSRLRVTRRFQMLRNPDRRTLLRALIHYVCIDLDSGKPKRMPPGFVAGYRPLQAVVDALGPGPDSFAPGVEPGC
jgi:acyl-CoA thioester hydrolase